MRPEGGGSFSKGVRAPIRVHGVATLTHESLLFVCTIWDGPAASITPHPSSPALHHPIPPCLPCIMPTSITCLHHLLPPSPAQPPSTTADAVKRISTRGRDACAKIGASTDIGARREVEAFAQLNAIWELLLSTSKGRYDLVGGVGD